MAAGDLKRVSTHLRLHDNKTKRHPDMWYYEEPEGLCVCATRSASSLGGSTGFIPWRQVKAALQRWEKKS